jgi:hypothetical protein
MLFLLNRILLEKASNEGAIEIRSNLNDQLDHRPVTTDEYMFHIQLYASR